MVVMAVIGFIASLVSMIVALLPNLKIDFTAVQTSSLYSVLEYVGAFVPVTQLGIILGLIFAVYSAEFLWLLLNWLLSKIPLIGD